LRSLCFKRSPQIALVKFRDDLSSGMRSPSRAHALLAVTSLLVTASLRRRRGSLLDRLFVRDRRVRLCPPRDDVMGGGLAMTYDWLGGFAKHEMVNSFFLPGGITLHP